jgi:hypothetical protein
MAFVNMPPKSQSVKYVEVGQSVNIMKENLDVMFVTEVNYATIKIINIIVYNVGVH